MEKLTTKTQVAEQPNPVRFGEHWELMQTPVEANIGLITDDETRDLSPYSIGLTDLQLENLYVTTLEQRDQGNFGYVVITSKKGQILVEVYSIGSWWKDPAQYYEDSMDMLKSPQTIEGSPDEVVISHALAKKLGLEVGSTITISLPEVQPKTSRFTRGARHVRHALSHPISFLGRFHD